MSAYSYWRFSSEKQRKGDSVRRQTDLRDGYLARKGLTLDTTLALADPALSAFPRRQCKEGALGAFLEGKIRTEGQADCRRQETDKEMSLLAGAACRWLGTTEWKAEIVRRVFRMIGDGWGYQSICKKLNAEKVPPIDKSRVWHQSYLVKLLASRAVLGEFRPCRFDDAGRRVSAGDWIKDYFPQIVDAKLWHEAHQALAARRSQRGMISPRVSDLFTHLCRVDAEPLCYRERNFVGYLRNSRKPASKRVAVPA